MPSRLDGDTDALYIRRAMKTFVCSIVCLGILVASAASLMRAAGPSPTLRKGKVLILKNEYTIEGDIERIVDSVGDRYCVRRKGGETWWPAERVLALVASMPDAYAYLRGRINLGDPDERLRLGRWCWNNGLKQQALTEAQAAAELRPTHAETRRLLAYWQQEAIKPRTGSLQQADSASHPATGTTQARSSTVANPSSASQKPADSPPIEVTTESLGLFVTRVQPILMNTCARCHATGHGGSFHLTQVFENSIHNRRTLERNLAAVLAEIDVNQPEASRLLVKAVSDHAHTGQAPLRDRQSAPYRALENWVKLTVADNPQLCGKSENRNPKSESSTPLVEEPRTKSGEDSKWGAEARSHAPAPPPSGKPKEKTASSQPAVATPDPYDPEPFNRKMHPEAPESRSSK